MLTRGHLKISFFAYLVIPAKAGIQQISHTLDSRSGRE